MLSLSTCTHEHDIYEGLAVPSSYGSSATAQLTNQHAAAPPHAVRSPKRLPCLSGIDLE